MCAWKVYLVWFIVKIVASMRSMWVFGPDEVRWKTMSGQVHVAIGCRSGKLNAAERSTCLAGERVDKMGIPGRKNNIDSRQFDESWTTCIIYRYPLSRCCIAFTPGKVPF
jgi:hypothetical protein